MHVVLRQTARVLARNATLKQRKTENYDRKIFVGTQKQPYGLNRLFRYMSYSNYLANLSCLA